MLVNIEKLTDTVLSVIEKMFPPAEQGTVQQVLMEEFSDRLPLIKSTDLYSMERIQLAVLKISKVMKILGHDPVPQIHVAWFS